jgi:uncharacterized membrane protein YdjX (TVP38/TMEM64 family)
MKEHLRVVSLAALLIALILVPFALFQREMDEATTQFLAVAHRDPLITAAGIALLLAADVFLPIPSSIVSTAAGYLLGAAGGTAASFVGMTLGCIAGYATGARLGQPAAARIITPLQARRLTELSERHGDWVLAISRPVPVLAEASVLLAGIARTPYRRFLVITSLANAGISFVYAFAGALSVGTGSFLLAFAAALVLPAGYSWLRARAAHTSVPAVHAVTRDT